MNITISDIGHTLVMLDQELDRLSDELERLDAQIQANRARAGAIRAAMKQLIANKTYELLVI